MGRSLAPDTPCSLSSPPLCLCWLAPSHRAGPQAPRSPGTRAWGAGGLHPGAAQEAEGDERGVSSRPRCGLGLVGRATGWQPVQHRGGGPRDSPSPDKVPACGPHLQCPLQAPHPGGPDTGSPSASPAQRATRCPETGPSALWPPAGHRRGLARPQARQHLLPTPVGSTASRRRPVVRVPGRGRRALAQLCGTDSRGSVGAVDLGAGFSGGP